MDAASQDLRVRLTFSLGFLWTHVMPRFMKLLCCSLLLVPWLMATQALAETDIDTAIESLQAEMKTLAEGTQPDSEKREFQEAYQNTLKYLERTRQTTEDRQNLEQQVQDAPTEIRALRQRIENMRPQDPDAIRRGFTNQSLEALEQLLSDKVATMFAWQNDLTSVNGDLIAAQTRPEHTQASVSEHQAREQSIIEQTRILQRQPDSRLTQANLNMLKAEQNSLQLATRYMREQLSANSLLQDLATQRRDLLKQQISDIGVEVQILQDVINEKRLSQSEQTVSETTQAVQTSENELLREQGTLNQRLSEELLLATTRVGGLTSQNIQTLQQIESLTQIDRALDQQIDVLEGSVLLSRILHQQKRALPSVRLDNSVADQIADLRLRQFELNTLRDELSQPTAYLNKLLGRLPEEQRDNLREDMQLVISNRIDLVDQLSSNINTLLSQAITLQINQRQLQQLSSDLRRTIDDQLFWVASNRRIDRAWVASLPKEASRQLQDIHLVSQAGLVVKTLKNHWPVLLLLVLLVALHTWSRRRIKQMLFELNEDVGHFRRDTIYHTPKALTLSALNVVPIPMVLAVIGLLLNNSDEPTMTVLGAALLKLSVTWFVLHLLYRILDPKGIAVRHFRWDAALVNRLHRLTRNMAWIMLPVVLIISLNAEVPEQQTSDVIGRTLMLVGMLLLSGLLGRMMLRSEPLYRSRVLHFTAMLVLTLTPLALAGMTYWGYHYTSTKLADRFLDTLYLIVLWMLVQGTVARNLNVAGRRLAYQRALAKREAAQNRENLESDIAIEVPGMDIHQINQQSLRLAKLGILVLFGVLVYLVWSDLISAASYLESVTLWEYASGTPENPTSTPMSAADVLGALLIVVFTITLARNLPGLLEILVLSRMKLQQGSSYAITTLMSYIIVSIGVISGLSALGVSWDKLQWLVAALSVGLGFGLQEIFANFVSGLIILFEKPIRIGDVVTIGQLSGTVNRIRIRATTITDFDRKEIIIPNKTFVTDHLINWSLSDTITRVILKFGVAYGSDLQKTRELLLQAARNNARVLKDPEPLVLFLNFSESMLEHELRIHVRELIDRNMAIDEINREISQLFKANGIEIAFRQLDVNLRTMTGLEKNISSSPLDDKGGQNKPASPDSPAAI